MRIYSKIIIFLLFVALGMVFIITLIFTTGEKIVRVDRKISNSFRVINMLTGISTNVYRSESDFTMYIVSGEKSFSNDIRKTGTVLFEQIGLLHQLSADYPSQQLKIEALRDLIKQRDEKQHAVMDSLFRYNNQIITAESSVNRKIFADSINQLVKDITVNELANIKLKSAKIKELSNRELLIAATGGVFYLFFAVLLFFKIQRDSRLRRIIELDMITREARYRQLIEDAGLPMFTTDRPGNFTFVNNKMETITGFAKNEITGSHFSFVVSPEYRDIVTARYREQYEKQIPELLIDFPITTKDQQEKWVEQHSVLIKREGRIVGFQCIVKDITERKRAEANLHEIQNERKASELYLQAMLDSMPLLVYIKDLDGKYLMANKRFQKLIAPSQTVIGKTDYDFDNTENADYNKSADQKIIESLEPMEQQYDISRDGVTHQLLLLRFPICSKKRRIIAVGGIAVDIGKRGDRLELLTQQKLKSEKAEEQLRKVLAIFTGEMATHFAKVGRMKKALLETSLNSEQKNLIIHLHKSDNRLLHLSNDIDYILRIKSGQIPVNTVGFNVEELMNNVIAPFKSRMKEKQIEMITGIHPEIPEMVVGDPVHLEQIMSNLLKTAVQSTEKGYIQMGAFPALRQGLSSVKFIIKDNGAGIPASRLDHIFESSSTGGTNAEQQDEGSALSLYITKQLIDFHNGTIDVTSVEGTGTTFRFSIPYQV